MAQYVEITIRYPHEDPDVPVEEEIGHWLAGTIDCPTIIAGCDEPCRVTGKIVELESIDG